MDLTTTKRENSKIMNVFHSNNYNTNLILRYLNNRFEPNGFFAGYKPLHLACMHSQEEMVKTLIEEHNVDVNITADDGAQPIHLACLLEKPNNLKILLKNGANVNAELSRSLFSKHRNSEDWCDDFGDEMTPLAFATVYGLNMLINVMCGFDPSEEIKSVSNRNLLMYAIERHWYTGHKILLLLSNRDTMINVRDNDGYSAIHYLFHPKNYDNYRFKRDDFSTMYKPWIAHDLIENNTDIYATVNNDPITLPLNTAAYRSSSSMLKKLLPHYEYLTKSRALYYATLPYEDSQTLMDFHPSWDPLCQIEDLELHRNYNIELIIADLIFRLTFNLFVPKEEHRLLEKLTSMDPKIREIVHSYKMNFIEAQLKSKMIQFDSKSITYYDFAVKCCDRRQLRLTIKNKVLIKAFENSQLEIEKLYRYCDHYNDLLSVKIKNAQKRAQLLDELKKVKQLRKAVPLPFELILETVEYLYNYELEKFINAFSSK